MQSHLSRRLVAGLLATAASLIALPAMAEVLKAQFKYSIVEVDDTGAEILVEREMVRPGETIEYSMIHENASDEDLTGLVLGGPIPDGASLAVDKQASSVPAVFEVQAELEPESPGLEWSTWPAERKIIEADGSLRVEPLPADAVEAVRWTLDAALPSGETALNSYRVVVN